MFLTAARSRLLVRLRAGLRDLWLLVRLRGLWLRIDLRWGSRVCEV